ncbi:MAG: DUF1152 domain-containing protein [Akkermansiaceae bacterium]|nr:DUF1152 domain-containing protein [Armatimonadota bacterium]
MELSRLPFFDALANAETVLLAGAGGGYDIFAGLPLYFALRGAGKTVHLANLSFTHIYATNGRRMGPALIEITHETEGSTRYFPEGYLCQWFYEERGETTPVYCFDRAGAKPVADAYRNLISELGGVDAVVLIDGGTDSLMRGDEAGLGTPEEDSVSLYAVSRLTDVATKLLVCIGFGVDTFHGVCHAQFLESVAALARDGAYLGAWSLLGDMPEVRAYQSAADYVHAKMFNHPSIVNSSVLSAVDGQFGNYHATYRTEGSELFINPLMSLYWAFQLDAVASRNLYLDRIGETEDYAQVALEIMKFRALTQSSQREWVSLPM